MITHSKVERGEKCTTVNDSECIASLNMLRIGFIGGGKMAQAMAKGFVSAGLTKNENILASCIPQDTVSLKGLKELGIPTTFDNKDVVKQSEVVFLATKPMVIPTVLQDVKSVVTPKNLFMSVAMGVTLKTLEQNLPAQSRVIRVMPNTPALVREGASVFVRGTSIKDDDAQIAKKLLDAIGTCEEVKEYDLDSVTALSGSGPAYIYIMIEALADGAVRMGLARDLAYKLAAQTVKGAGTMVLETGGHPGKLKDDVTSPGGSTAAGLYQLEKGGLRAAVITAIEEATKKCKEMAKSSQ